MALSLPNSRNTTVTVVQTTTKTVKTYGKPKRKPMTFTFLIDCSGSMAGSRIKATVDAVKTVVGVLTNSDLTCLKVFNHERPRTVFPLIKPQQVRWAQARKKIKPDGGTRLYDAIATAIREIPRNTKYDRFHRELIVLTDGEDMNSKMSYKELQQLVDKPGVKNFHLILIGVGVTAQYKEKLANLSSKKNYRYLDSTANADQIKKAFGRAKDVALRYVKTEITTTVTETRTGQISGDSADKVQNQLVIAAKGTSAHGDQLIRSPRSRKATRTPRVSCLIGNIRNPDTTKDQIRDFFQRIDPTCKVTSDLRFNSKHKAYYTFVSFANQKIVTHVTSKAFGDAHTLEGSKLFISQQR